MSITVDGATTLSFAATDNAGNVETTRTLTIKLDKTPPAVSSSITPAPNAAGWNTTNVTVNFSCTDALSGVANVTAPMGVSTEGANQSVPGSCADVAGNTATTAVIVNIEKTPPTITSSATTAGSAYTAGAWTNKDVVISFACTSLSGPANLTTPVTVSADGANQSASGTCTDRAGNTASTTFSGIFIDKTPPTTTAALAGKAGGGGWFTGPVTVTLTATDALSGVASTTFSIDGGASQTYTAPFTISADGTHTVSFGSTDAAGNVEANKAVSVRIDQTPPVTTATPAPGALPPGTPLVTVRANATVKSTTGATLGTISVTCFDTLGLVVNLNAVDNPGGSGVASLTYASTGAQPIASTTVSGAWPQPRSA